jgi:phospholipase C
VAKDLSRIRQVVIVMMENRSFDHMLGYLSLPEFHHPRSSEIEGVRQAKEFYHGHQFMPHPLQNPALSPDPPHERCDVSTQIANTSPGAYKMDGFVSSYMRWLSKNGFLGASSKWLSWHNSAQPVRPDGVMEYCIPRQLPTTDFLARNFTICDQYFASLPASTLPNRLFAMSGHALTDITPDGFLSDARNFFFLHPDDLLYKWLTNHSIPWRVYHQGSPFFACCHSLKGETSDPNLFKNLSQLAHDAANDDLIGVTFVEPQYQDDPYLGHQQATDDHPPASIWGGERFLKLTYDAVLRSPSWANTVMIVTYDEHGGFFDHVPPRAAPAPTSPGATYQPFQTSGLRVPTIVVSPFVRELGVSHTVLDHTSILRFLAELYKDSPFNKFVADRNGFESLSAVLDDELLAPGAPTRPAPGF